MPLFGALFTLLAATSLVLGAAFIAHAVALLFGLSPAMGGLLFSVAVLGAALALIKRTLPAKKEKKWDGEF